MEIVKENSNGTIDAIIQTQDGPMLATGLYPKSIGNTCLVGEDKIDPELTMAFIGVPSKTVPKWLNEHVAKSSAFPSFGGLTMLSDGIRTLLVDSVCLMVNDVDDKLIVVSRKDNHADLGMPGGKIESGEDAVMAILRECAEELGVDYQPEDLDVFYVGPCGEHTTVCYVLKDKRNGRPIREGRLMSDSINKEGALVTRVNSIVEICDIEKSCFAAYNKAVMDHHLMLIASNDVRGEI